MGNPERHGGNRHDSFVRLLQQHQRALHKVCWVYGTHSHDRDDLLQEIIAHLWSAYPGYEPDRRFLTWMYRIALNVAIDHLRRRKRQSRVWNNLEQQALAATPGVSDIERQQELLDLHCLLDQQSDADRALLLLYLEGQSHREIGDILGMSETNISTRLSRLKQSLRQTILQDSKETGHATR